MEQRKGRILGYFAVIRFVSSLASVGEHVYKEAVRLRDRESGGGQCLISQPTGEEGLGPNKTTTKKLGPSFVYSFPG